MIKSPWRLNGENTEHMYSKHLSVYTILKTIHLNISIHRYLGCLHDIEIQIFKRYGYLMGIMIGPRTYSYSFKHHLIIHVLVCLTVDQFWFWSPVEMQINHMSPCFPCNIAIANIISLPTFNKGSERSESPWRLNGEDTEQMYSKHLSA